jgi:hypothetical protein
MSLLIDEVSRPNLRQHIGRLLAACTTADIAVGHIRLAALDLSIPETERVERCRILLGRLEARALTGFGDADVLSGRRSIDDAAASAPIDERMRTLLVFLESGRVQIRSAGLGAWSPDFSVYHGVPDGDVCLLGAHYFREPPSTNGPSFTALLKDPRCIAMVGARFDALWQRSHDVLEPIVSAVHRAQSCHPA